MTNFAPLFFVTALSKSRAAKLCAFIVSFQRNKQASVFQRNRNSIIVVLENIPTVDRNGLLFIRGALQLQFLH